LCVRHSSWYGLPSSYRFLEVAALAVGGSEGDQTARGAPPRQVTGLARVANRGLAVAQTALRAGGQEVGEEVVRRGRFRAKQDRLVLVGDGLVVLPLLLVGRRAAGIGVGLVRIEADGLGEIGDGLVVLVLPEARHPPAVVGELAPGIETDGLGEVVAGA